MLAESGLTILYNLEIIGFALNYLLQVLQVCP